MTVNILQNEILSEESLAPICVFLGTSNVEKSVNITVTPIADGTATGRAIFTYSSIFLMVCFAILAGGVDFSLENVSILISPPDATGCANVIITDDDIREGEETFSVTISSTDDAVLLGSSTAVVTIRDDDGKHLYIHM